LLLFFKKEVLPSLPSNHKMTHSPPLLVLSRIIIDDLHFADGTMRPATPGGAGLHAAAGAALWWPKIAPVAGVGADIHEVTRGMLRSERFVPDGLLLRDPCSTRSRLVYAPDGGRTETSILGPDHFARLEVHAGDIPDGLLPAAGIYIFRDTDAAFWHSIDRISTSLGIILWELHADAATQGHLPALHAILPRVDVFSLNLSEGRGLFGDMKPDAMLDALLAAGARIVLLRMGARGAIAATPSQRLHALPPPCDVIDETGGGNSFCGGFLASLCAAPGDIERALRRASASAACAIGQFGPAPLDTDRAEAFARATPIARLAQAAMA
jgi:sugar/nucleoside kinase (ribokinase family)